MRNLLAIFLVAATCLAIPLRAQESSGGLLVGFLEDTLSGDSRYIKVTGLQGALSARATIEQITVADDDGIWLTINDAVLDWNRLALIRKRFSVNALTAGEIIIARAPTPIPADPELPSPEATPFQLPELPVAIEIEDVSVKQLELGEALIGIAATLNMTGAVRLADGALDTSLSVTRIDRPTDVANLIAKFDNATSQIDLDLQVEEEADGLLSEVLEIPGRPSVRLTAKGAGLVEDFTADIALASDGEPRLSGQVRLQGVATPGVDDPAAPKSIAFTANLGGNVTPLLDPEYQEFFGDQTQLDVAGRRDPDGQLDISQFAIKSGALDLDGALGIAADGTIRALSLQGGIAPPDGADVVLPLTGPRTALRGVQISALFDAETGSAWKAELTVDGVDRPDVAVSTAQIKATGTIDQTGETSLRGQITAALDGVKFTDPALNKAVGETVALDGQFVLLADKTLQLNDFALEGANYGAMVDVDIRGLDSGFQIDGKADVTAADLSRFDDLAGQPIGGAISASMTGSGAPLNGTFDVVLTAQAEDLVSGNVQVDPLITGKTNLSIDAGRNAEGIDLRSFTLAGDAVTAQAKGTIKSRGTALEFDATLDDLSRLLAEVSGPLRLSGKVNDEAGNWSGDVRLDGPDGSFADLTGTLMSEGSADVVFDAEMKMVERFVEQFKGDLSARGTASRALGQWQFDSTVGGSVGIAAKLKGKLDEATGDATFDYDATLARVERLVPQIEGDLKAEGTASRASGKWRFDSNADAAFGIAAKLTGNLDEASGDAEIDFDATLARVERFVPQFKGDLSARGSATRSSGQWQVDTTTGGSIGVTTRLAGNLDEASGDAAFDYDATLARVERFVPQFKGDLNASGTANRSSGQWQLATTTGGSVGIDARLKARLDEASGDTELDYDATLAGVERFVPQLVGDLSARGIAGRTSGQWQFDSTIDGSAGIKAKSNGNLDEASGDADFDYDATLAGIERFVPEVRGDLSAKGSASRTSGRWQFDSSADGSAGIGATVKGKLDEASGDADFEYDATLAGIERLVPGFAGGASARGTAQRTGSLWQFDARADGPVGLDVTASGTLDQDTLDADLATKGQLQLGAANRFISPNLINGTARFDLKLKGKPGLEALSGSISTAGATVALPEILQTIRNLHATITIANSQAQLLVTGGPQAGGRFRVAGPVALTPPFNSTLVAELQQLVITDNIAIRSSANGQLTFSGPLTGNGNLSGQIEFGETEINLAAASGSVSAAPIPPITHRGENAAVRATQDHAGLNKADTGNSGPVIGLDVSLIAQKKVFARGRGLDAELGGNILIRGTTAKVVPSGQISLIRGTFDILGRRLKLTEGRVTLQGKLVPYIEFAASTSTSDGQATLEISGPLNSPKVEVYSVPDRPTEEALAMLIFGNRFSELSPLKIAQLAAQLAELSGQGGGTTRKVREKLGVDVLDVGTDESGAASAGVGTYLSDSVYTDITVNARGESEINLNLDLNEKLTVRGSVDNTGDTGIGLFFKRDY